MHRWSSFFFARSSIIISSRPNILLRHLHDLPKPTNRDVAIANLSNAQQQRRLKLQQHQPAAASAINGSTVHNKLTTCSLLLPFDGLIDSQAIRWEEMHLNLQLLQLHRYMHKPSGARKHLQLRATPMHNNKLNMEMNGGRGQK
jgi:hypothetical protein